MKHWQTKTLGDLFDITSSKRVFESDWKTEGVPFYRAREIVKLAKQGFVDNELFISEEMYNQYAAKYGIPAEGDIMVTGVGTLGICFVVKKHDRFYFKDGNIIWLKKKTDTNSHFVEYAFQSDCLRSQIDDSVGATVGTYTIIKAKSTCLPVPPLAEQERIVKLLDEANELRKLRTQADRSSAALIPALFYEMFGDPEKNEMGWPKKQLGEVVEVRRERIEPTEYPTKMFNYVGLENMEGHTGNLLPYQPTLGSKIKSTKNVFRCGEILYGKLRPYLNKVHLANTEGICSTDIYVIRQRQQQLHPSFVEIFLRSPFVLNVVSNAMAGANLPRIGQNSLLAISVPVPPFELQTEFAQRVTKIRELEASQATSRTRLDALFQSMLHRAFNGEL